MIYGIEHGGSHLHAGLSIAVPSACADAAIEGTTDIALVPVAEVPRIPQGSIITDFCISSDGDVDTVALLSNTPIRELDTVYLDWHSRTSVQLVRVLSRELWGNFDRIQWLEIPRDRDFYAEKLTPGSAVVAIGDKVFDIQERYVFKTDLAQEWKRLTGLPFVFAVWVAVSAEGRGMEQALNRAIEWGVAHTAEAIKHYKPDSNFDRAYRYLTHNIQFRLTPQGRQAIKLFWEKIITPG